MRQLSSRLSLVFVLLFAVSPAARAVGERVAEIDAYAAKAGRDWSADYLARTTTRREAADAAAKKVEDARVPSTKPSLPLASYAGVYTGAMFGDARVFEENGRPVLRLLPSPFFVGDLEHWHFDTFRARWRETVVYPFPRGFVTFTLGPQGRPDEMKIDVPNPDFDFKSLSSDARPTRRPRTATEADRSSQA